MVETDYELQVAKWHSYMGRALLANPKIEPEAKDFIMVALGYDPDQDGLYLCPQCGITFDGECSYGGWHGPETYVEVSVPWMAK